MKVYEVMVQDCGTKEWYLNGKLHREDGPAIEYVSGTKMWYLNGKLHREDGPAAEGSGGTKEWWLNGHQATAQ
jgi:antitoxin component YwqK of YwqJK toxin-antitoxin module